MWAGSAGCRVCESPRLCTVNCHQSPCVGAAQPSDTASHCTHGDCRCRLHDRTRRVNTTAGLEPCPGIVETIRYSGADSPGPGCAATRLPSARHPSRPSSQPRPRYGRSRGRFRRRWSSIPRRRVCRGVQEPRQDVQESRQGVQEPRQDVPASRQDAAGPAPAA